MNDLDRPRKNALPAKRQTDLVELLQVRGQMLVVDIAEYFQVSEDTVRRDLDSLAERGALTRTHGGAVAMTALVHRDSPFFQRLNSHTAEKQRIARAAVALIGDGETLLINGGSTTRFFGAELTQPNLTIVTNNLAIPGALSNALGAEIYLLGGQFRAGPQVTIGPVAPAGIHVAVDTAIIGIGGLTAREGLSTTILEEASMIAAMIAAARRTIVVADSSKLGKHSFAQICSLTSIQLMVTDAEPPRELRAALEDARVQIVLG